jgi:glycerol-3-phosphate dehydrogenase (NAD(P)+)
MKRFVILGTGMMGSAMAFPLADRGHELRLVGTELDREIIAGLERDGVHAKLGDRLPENLRFFQLENLAEALAGADGVVLGVSSAGVEWSARTLAPFLEAATEPLPLLMIAKGLRLEGGKVRVLPEALAHALPERARARVSPVAVAGPCIAGELSKRAPTCVVFTSASEPALEFWKAQVEAPYYHVWTSLDVVGVEVCAALKNAYAMGIALATGLNEARGGKPGSIGLHNLESAIFAQSIFEMARVVELAGGERESVFWLPGVGDLDVTTNGGRTGRFGKLLGLGIGRDAAIERMQGATLECLEILAVMRAIVAEFERRGALGRTELPLLRELCRIALDSAPVDLPLDRFFSRRPG